MFVEGVGVGGDPLARKCIACHPNPIVIRVHMHIKSYSGTTRYYIGDLKPAIGASKKVSKCVIEVRHVLEYGPRFFWVTSAIFGQPTCQTKGMCTPICGCFQLCGPTLPFDFCVNGVNMLANSKQHQKKNCAKYLLLHGGFLVHLRWRECIYTSNYIPNNT